MFLKTRQKRLKYSFNVRTIKVIKIKSLFKERKMKIGRPGILLNIKASIKPQGSVRGGDRLGAGGSQR